MKCLQLNGSNTYASTEQKKMQEDTHKYTELVTQNHNTAETIDKTVNLLWTNTGQYETMMSQLLCDTVDPEEQAIILRQLQAVI